MDYIVVRGCTHRILVNKPNSCCKFSDIQGTSTDQIERREMVSLVLHRLYLLMTNRPVLRINTVDCFLSIFPLVTCTGLG